jgi:quercetin dioxygenase-like cupin family protein
LGFDSEPAFPMQSTNGDDLAGTEKQFRSTSNPREEEPTMSISIKHRLMAVAAATGCLLALAGAPAQAGECPKDQVVPVGKGPTSGPDMPKGVTDTVLASADLGGWIEGIGNRKLRVRELIIQPGGIVPWHDHADRPALIQVVRGEIYEHRSTCAVPVLHKAGEFSIEAKDVMHWWENTSQHAVILHSSDILHEADDPHVM